jgi:hypothetical protein
LAGAPLTVSSFMLAKGAYLLTVLAQLVACTAVLRSLAIHMPCALPGPHQLVGQSVAISTGADRCQHHF